MAGEERGTAVGSDERTEADGCASGSASAVRASGLAAPPISLSAPRAPALTPVTEPEPQPEPPAVQHDHRAESWDSDRGQFPCGCSDS